MAFGVASWRGLTVSFTDGMCARCAVRFRLQWKLPLPSPPLVPRLPFVPVAATLLVVIGLMLAARPLDEARAPATMTLPPETVLVPPPIEAPSPAPAPAPRAPRRVSPRPPSIAVAAVPSPLADPAPLVAVTPAEPVVEAAAITAPAVVVDLPVEMVRAPARPRRGVAGVAFASIPHAGLTQQTP